jgi:hypothetical protein
MDPYTQGSQLPIPIEKGPSNYGATTELDYNIRAAKQYNPAAGIGLRNDGKPSNAASPTLPHPAITAAANPPAPTPAPAEQANPAGPSSPVGSSGRRGFGPSSGIGESIAPQGPSFASGDLKSHFAHLASLPDASPAILWYARQLHSQVSSEGQ